MSLRSYTNLKIAVLSGKGGTGKTFVSVNLAYHIPNASYFDCDVEEPNGQEYFRGNYAEEIINVKVPQVNHDVCIKCGKCSDFCKYNALTLILDKVRVFPQLCHSCGGCSLVCPVGAISEKDKPIGLVRESIYDGHRIVSGELHVKEETGVKIIEHIMNKADSQGLTVIDCPPGNGCSVMECIRDADYLILVAEPTIFGLHNLNMVFELAQVFSKKVGIVINKASDNPMIREYAYDKEIPVLCEIPFDQKMGYLNSIGEIVVKDKKYAEHFNTILNKIAEEFV
jgi:MinD superfamily P-loop ATPase